MMELKLSPQYVQRKAILEQRDRLLQVPGLQSSKSLQKLLTFLIDKAITEADPNLKEYVIAVEVFGREESFDPKLDSIVRVHASRLRSKLKNYSASAGADDSIVISLPERGYCPVIQLRPPEPEPKVVDLLRHKALALNTLLIRPFVPLGGGTELRYFTQGLTDELIHLMTHCSSLRIIASSGSPMADQQDTEAAILEGRVRQRNGHFRICAHLINPRDRSYLWADGFTRKVGNEFLVQRSVSRAIFEALQSKLFGAQA
jgi:TolB-like protein